MPRLPVRLPARLPLVRPFHSGRPSASAWAAAASVAGNVLSHAVKKATGMAAQNSDLAIDPLKAIAKEMRSITGNMRQLLGSEHPALDRIAKYYTQAEGKFMRPMLVLLMSRATEACPKQPPSPSPSQQPLYSPLSSSSSSSSSSSPLSPPSPQSIDISLSPLSILSDLNPSSSSSSETEIAGVLPSQRRLAEITELIHTASLLHDDVIDHSESRRGSPSANLMFGNKMAVLGGDFLLGRASVALARLRHVEVVELLSTVIANLVEGEFMQLKNTERDETKPVWTEEALQYYLRKTYLKTASLISKSCRAAALLGGSDAQTVDAAYLYGKNLGLAFQLVDDMLDYTQKGSDGMGKPTGADLDLGLATAPLLFAWKTRPELGELVGRKFARQGDASLARSLVLQTDGIEQTHVLAQAYCREAKDAIQHFPDTEAKQGLLDMVDKALQRKK